MVLFRRLIALLLLVAAWPACAAVTITFYSHDFGSSFPHAFIVLDGAPDAGGPPVTANYGFTAKRVTPAVLMGSVEGEIMSAGPAYVANSQPHWRMTLTDAQYAQVLATMAKWRAIPGKSYNLNRRNCVHFVADMARSLGMDVPEPKELMLKPRSFLEATLRHNAALEVAAADGAAAIPTLTATAAGIADTALALAPPPTAAALDEKPIDGAAAAAAQARSNTSRP